MPNGLTETEARLTAGVTDSAAEQELVYEPFYQIQVSGGPLLSRLILSVEKTEDGQTIVADELLSTYGVGDTVREALDEFMSMLLDYYEELSESRVDLSRFLSRQLHILERVLGETH